MCREGAWTELTTQVTSVVAVQSETHGLIIYNYVNKARCICAPGFMIILIFVRLTYGKGIYPFSDLTVSKMEIVQLEGSRHIKRKVAFYNHLDVFGKDYFRELLERVRGGRRRRKEKQSMEKNPCPLKTFVL